MFSLLDAPWMWVGVHRCKQGSPEETSAKLYCASNRHCKLGLNEKPANRPGFGVVSKKSLQVNETNNANLEVKLTLND